MVSNGPLGAEICAKGKVEMFYSNLVTGPTVLIWENARCSATRGPMKIPRPGFSRTRSVAQFMNLKQCYLRKLYSWYVLPQLGQKCFLNYSKTQKLRESASPNLKKARIERSRSAVQPSSIGHRVM